MITHDIPLDLRIKIRKYLQYNWELKKEVKIEEEELMNLLNEDLRNLISSCYTGRIILKTEFFERNFELDFLSILSTFLVKVSYSSDETIIYEH